MSGAYAVGAVGSSAGITAKLAFASYHGGRSFPATRPATPPISAATNSPRHRRRASAANPSSNERRLPAGLAIDNLISVSG